MTVLAASMNKENQQPNNNNNSGNTKPQQKVVAKTRNMGGYCYSCGYHPIGLGHNSQTCTSRHKRKEHKSDATWSDRMGGNTTWPKVNKVTTEQQEHAKWKGQLAPTNWQGLGITCDRKNDDNIDCMNKTLASNYYACLSPPPCQVKEHEQNKNTKRVKFKTTIEVSPSTPAASQNKLKARWEQMIKKQREKDQTNNTSEVLHPAP